MRSIIFTILMLTSSITIAEDLFEFWVWQGTDATNDPLTIEIATHELCGRKIVKIKTNTMPINNPVFVPEKAYEYTKDGKKINTWNMPIDYIVYGIEGKDIITGYGSLEKSLKVDTAGILNEHEKIKYEATNIQCKVDTNSNTALERCFSYKDIKSGEERVLLYRAPCS